MNEFDGRRIDRKALEEIRIRAVKSVESGESPEVVIKALGLTRPRIYEWLVKYREGGIDALRRRKAPGKAPKLSGQHSGKYIVSSLVLIRDNLNLSLRCGLVE
jgi:transposase